METIIIELCAAIKPYAVPVLIGLIAFIKRTTLARISAQVAHDYNVKLEEIKCGHAKRQVVQRVQFEAEFKMYTDLWKELSEWSSTFRTYRLMMAGPAGDNREQQEAQANIFKETYNEFSKLFKTLLAFKPFLHGTVHDEFNSIIREYDSELIKYLMGKEKPRPDDWFKEREAALANLEKRLYTDLPETIRQRIGIIEIIN